MFERFTPSARQVVVLAQEEAHALGHNYLGTEHLLLGMLGEDEGIASQCLREEGVTLEGTRDVIKDIIGACAVPGLLSEADAAALGAIGIDLDAVRARVEEAFGPGALGWGPPLRQRRFLRRRRCGDPVPGQLPFAPRAKKVLELARRDARHRGDDDIGTEHILLGLLHEGKGIGIAILVRSEVSLDSLRARVLGRLGEAA